MTEDYPLALPKGTVLAGQYQIDMVLGQGGFGITYRAKDLKNGTNTAIKEFFPDSLAARTNGTAVSAFSGERSESFEYGKSCFLKEAETLAQFIGNENIVRVISYFEENGTAYFVMEFIEGLNFDEYISQHGGKISFEAASRVLVPIMDALAAVHRKGIIHRDVTPDNIFITNDGIPKLLDFGAARYSLGDKSQSLDVVLKHGFAPKEQYTRRGKQGPYTDVYSLGASFYYAITGKRPPDSIERMDEDNLIPPSAIGIHIPYEAEEAILKALNLQPVERFQSMEEFRKALLGPVTLSGGSPKTELLTSGEYDHEESAKTVYIPREPGLQSRRDRKVRTKKKRMNPTVAAGLLALLLVLAAGVIATVRLSSGNGEKAEDTEAGTDQPENGAGTESGSDEDKLAEIDVKDDKHADFIFYGNGSGSMSDITGLSFSFGDYSAGLNDFDNNGNFQCSIWTNDGNGNHSLFEDGKADYTVNEDRITISADMSAVDGFSFAGIGGDCEVHYEYDGNGGPTETYKWSDIARMDGYKASEQTEAEEAESEAQTQAQAQSYGDEELYPVIIGNTPDNLINNCFFDPNGEYIESDNGHTGCPARSGSLVYFIGQTESGDRTGFTRDLDTGETKTIPELERFKWIERLLVSEDYYYIYIRDEKSYYCIRRSDGSIKGSVSVEDPRAVAFFDGNLFYVADNNLRGQSVYMVPAGDPDSKPRELVSVWEGEKISTLCATDDGIIYRARGEQLILGKLTKNGDEYKHSHYSYFEYMNGNIWELVADGTDLYFAAKTDENEWEIGRYDTAGKKMSILTSVRTAVHPCIGVFYKDGKRRIGYYVEPVSSQEGEMRLEVMDDGGTVVETLSIPEG